MDRYKILENNVKSEKKSKYLLTFGTCRAIMKSQTKKKRKNKKEGGTDHRKRKPYFLKEEKLLGNQKNFIGKTLKTDRKEEKNL